jgi:para-nitrobenzyl esterase
MKGKMIYRILFLMKEPTMKNNEKANQRLEHYGLTAKLLLGMAAIGVVMLSTVLTASADSSSQSPTALTESGVVIGSTMNGVNQFLGIPYAAPPVGDRRWTPPISYGKFQGSTLQATQFGSECTQRGGGGSEDCLFLNVYTPRGRRESEQSDSGYGGKRGLPVMVWFPGGGFTTGSSDPYDPPKLVKKGVIVVTINYRLGYLGFFAQSAIDAESHLKGNYGLMDQQFALNWVRRNIAGFGGDPGQVTIFGQSAGGKSVVKLRRDVYR